MLSEETVALALRAGEAILALRGKAARPELKSDGSPVTRADHAAAALILEGLRRLDPGVPIICEESGIPPYEERRGWERFWLVDPLDGTKEFIAGRSDFTVNIALIERSTPILGTVYAPALGVVYYAERGGGSWKRSDSTAPVRLRSQLADPARPLRVAVSRSHGSPELDRFLAGLKVRERVAAGSALKFGLMAEGAADLYARLSPTMEWDTAAGDCVWRDSASEGRHYSPLVYNKPDLRNGGFVLGAAPGALEPAF